MARLLGQAVGGKSRDLFGHDMNHAAFVLQAARDNERGNEIDRKTGLLEERGANNGVRMTGFVFERDKAKAFSRAGALAAPVNLNP